MSPKSPRRREPSQSLALLWSSQDEAGRSGVTVRSIVAAAMELADAEGISALSMKNVAARLGLGTMSLYTYFPSKLDLIDLMVDTAHKDLYENVDTPLQQVGGWRAALDFIARQNWRLLQRHPWLTQALGGRPVLGPHTTLKYEAELRPLDHLGLTDVEMDSVLGLILSHVRAAATLSLTMAETQKQTAMNEMEWWVNNEALLSKLMDARRFPTAARVGESAGQQHQGAVNPEHALDFGLTCILDGVEKLIAERRTRVS